MDSEEENVDSTVETLFNNAKGHLIPEKSKSVYLTSFDNFKSWQKNKNVVAISEEIIMAYFEDLSKTKAPSTLWSIYSMLKKTLRHNENVDISQYKNLIDLLKIKAKGFEPKKAKVFTSAEIERFINEAPNEQHLATKVCIKIYNYLIMNLIELNEQ